MFNFIKKLPETIKVFVKRKKITTALIILAMFIILTLLKGLGGEPVPEAVPQVSQVEVQSVRALVSGRLFTAVGTVEAVSEARLQTESGGRVTGVYTEIGKFVKAGSILVTLENASERAVLLQAEGAYESTLANAEQSKLGVDVAETALLSAKDGAITSMQNAYNTTNGIVVSDIDDFFSQPNSSIPGLRIGGQGYTQTLNSERVAYQTLLPAWNKSLESLTNKSSLDAELELSIVNVKRTINIIDMFLFIFNKDDDDEGQFVGKEEELISLKSVLNGVLSDLVSAKSNIISASEAKERAIVSATGGQVSATDAQLKQALGAYRSAQANFEKTIVRTPISGVVNALYLKTGEYVPPSAPAGIVANNNGLEVTTSVSEEDALELSVGDTVTIEKTATGTVSAIAGAIDPTTGKVAVKISLDSTSGIQNGNTVSIAFLPNMEKTDNTITIPLSSVKMTGSGPVVFSVSENKELVSIPVKLGPVSGNAVLVNEGITLDSQIVVDARGLKAGQVVTVSEN